ncbi:MAG: penicillin-binding protein activator [Alphaproteobacteria bacterium]|nr:penicillin-binding protein activator [Alphaproteobacteria bacterium]
MMGLLFVALLTVGMAGAEEPSEVIARADALAAQDRDAAIALLTDAVEVARRPDRGELWLHLGEHHRLAGHVDEAVDAFRESLATSRSGEVEAAARLGLALVEAGPTARATEPRHVATLRTAPAAGVLPSQLTARQALLARWAEAGGEDAATPEAEAPPLVRARDALARDDRAEAARLAAEAMSAGGTGEVLRGAMRLQDAAKGVAQVPGRVGVLLPLSGRFEAVGRQVEEALRRGWTAAGRTDGLVVADTGGTAEGALTAFTDLVKAKGVVAVLGPLLTDETPSVVDAADDVGVPLVVLSQALDRPDEHPWALRSWLTIRDQVDRLVAYAMDRRAWTRFVVLAPDSSYGSEAADRFVEAVQARGGTITARETYATDAKDFRALAVKLARRPDEETPPVVDYDAVFVPDKARRVTLVGSALAFEEIPVGVFDPHETGTVPLLGLSGWTSPELVAGGGKYLEGGIFTDVFLPPESSLSWAFQDLWGAFVTAWREGVGRTPTPVEVLARDTAHLVGAAMASAPPHRQAALEALLGTTVEGTVTGLSAISPTTRAADPKIRLFSVAKDGFVPIEE